MPRQGVCRIVLFAKLAVAASQALATGCVIDPRPCKGCGCHGGPGYREIASGRCVGFRELARKCGTPPNAMLCVFEDAPGTGANRECALASPAKVPK
jgi:hypothetical protein